MNWKELIIYLILHDTQHRMNIAMKNKIIILSLIGILLSTFTFAADDRNPKKKREHNEIHQALPEPDLLPQPLRPHRIVEAITEARRHHINGNEKRFGIDVSHYQGRINWDVVATDPNVSYAYLKATEGAGYLDDTYLYNLREARRTGVKVGCYHFFSPTASVMAQLKNFTSNVDLKGHDLIPIIDVETRGRSSLKDFCARLQTFLAGVEKHYGVKPIIYTSSNFYNKYLAGRFMDYKYMIARYHDEVPELTDDIRFVMWQFTASGRINGIRTAVDRSRFMDDYDLSDILLP